MKPYFQSDKMYYNKSCILGFTDMTSFHESFQSFYSFFPLVGLIGLVWTHKSLVSVALWAELIIEYSSYAFLQHWIRVNRKKQFLWWIQLFFMGYSSPKCVCVYDLDDIWSVGVKPPPCFSSLVRHLSGWEKSVNDDTNTCSFHCSRRKLAVSCPTQQWESCWLSAAFFPL